jgi:hypothetical protein
MRGGRARQISCDEYNGRTTPSLGYYLRVSSSARIVPTDQVPPLVTGTRLLHIGPHKTGTTSLQNSIRANREEILRQGVYYGAPEGRLASNRIARSLLRLPFKNPNEVVDYREWEDQVAQVQASNASRVIVSGEEFSFCETQEIQTVLKDLGRDRVHVVITARPLARVLPSQWQLDLRGSFTSSSFDEWLGWTLKPRGARRIAQLIGVPHPFWFRHRHDQLASRWADAIGVDRVSVVVVDDRDHHVLLTAFERLLGLTGGTLLPVDGKSNPSLSAQEIAIILRVQQLMQKHGLIFADRVRSRQIQRRLLSIRPRLSTDQKIALPQWAVPAVSDVSRSVYDGLLASGVRIIGEPELLLQVQSQGQRVEVDRSEIDSYATQMIAQLEADGKLRRGSTSPRVGKAVSRAFRRIKRLF